VLRRSDLQLILVGGTVNPMVGGCIDAAAILSLSQMNIDRCFIGACSVSPATGVSAFDFQDATFKRALFDASHHRQVLAMTDKFSVRAPHRIASVKEFNQIVIEHDAPSQIIDALTQAGALTVRADQSS
jgi:DeoR/GlpR family transcriptional regulator of sugar metabolism